MAELWIPQQTPPQISEEAQSVVLSLVLEEGITPIANTALLDLQYSEELLGEYLDRLGYDFNKISAEGFWPERVLKIGASLALLAYRETGYLQTINETAFEQANMIAMLEGIPEAYFSSTYADLGLVQLLDNVIEAPELREEDGGYYQMLTIGAGCTRFYMQQAIAA